MEAMRAWPPCTFMYNEIVAATGTGASPSQDVKEKTSIGQGQ